MSALAVFIILLAFFIMLSGLSGFSTQKVKAAAESVREAFGVSSFIYQGGIGDSVREQKSMGGGAGTSLSDVAGTFEHEVPGLKPMLMERTGTLQMDIPFSAFNRLVGLTPADNGRILPEMGRLVYFIGARPDRRYLLILQVNHRSGAPSQYESLGVTETFLPIWRARLLSAGLDPERFLLGVGRGRAGTVSVILEPMVSQGTGADEADMEKGAVP